MAKTTPSFADFDIAKFFETFQIPGVDTQALVNAQQKNIEAVNAANRAALEGMQALMARQSAILNQTIQEANKAIKDFSPTASPQDAASKQVELMRTAFEKALGNMREMAEMVAKSNNQAFDIMAKRVNESLTEIKTLMGQAGKK